VNNLERRLNLIESLRLSIDMSGAVRPIML
jgi:hypothetical protein